MPATIKLKELYGDALAVIFVESQGASADVAEAFAWRQKWMRIDAMWTGERPVHVEGNTIPKFALIAADGTVLHTGNPLEMKKQIEESIAAEVKKSTTAPDGTPKELAKAWSAFIKNDVAVAIAECDKLASDAAKAAKEEFSARTSAKIERAKWLADNGFVPQADALVAALQKSTKGVADLAQKLDEVARALAAESLKSEREAAKALVSLEAKIATDKPFDESNVKKLQGIAEKFKNTKAAQRASHLVALSKIKPAR